MEGFLERLARAGMIDPTLFNRRIAMDVLNLIPRTENVAWLKFIASAASEAVVKIEHGQAPLVTDTIAQEYSATLARISSLARKRMKGLATR